MKFPLRAAAMAALLCITAASAASAKTFTVGGDLSCTHRSLARALAAAQNHEGKVTIRVARNSRHRLDAMPTLHDDVRLVGGYSRCSDDVPLGTTPVVVNSSAVAAGLADSNRVTGIRIDAQASNDDAVVQRIVR